MSFKLNLVLYCIVSQEYLIDSRLTIQNKTKKGGK